MPHDLVIRDGLVVDGTGEPAFRGDVAIDGDTIVGVGGSGAIAAREIDAGGRVVTPGFIDLHTHLDAQLARDGAVTPTSWHGITTVLMGNCGVTFAPCRSQDRETLAQMMEAVEDIPHRAILDGMPWNWDS